MTDTKAPIAPVSSLVRTSSTARSLALTLLFALLTSLGARLSVHLPFTPVPLTLQVLFVILSGAVLGSRLGALSQAQYLAMGVAGFPVFAGGASGIMAFGGPTAGYLVGFVLAAWLAGYLAERITRPSTIKLFPAMMAGVAAIHIPGALWLSVWMQATRGGGSASAITHAMFLGIVPFIGVDTVKAAVAAGIGAGLRRSAR